MAKILLVDGEQSERRMLRLALEGEHQVIEASNGADGLILFDYFNPDLVIANTVTSNISGFELARQIKASGKKAKLIFASRRFNVNGVYSQLFEEGSAVCLQKPFQKPALLRTVSSLLSKK